MIEYIVGAFVIFAILIALVSLISSAVVSFLIFRSIIKELFFK